MSDKLPDIEFKEKKEKKGGVLGWLRGKMGMGGRGATGSAGINPAAMNAGRGAANFGKAFGAGAGKFGASGGLAGLLAGKAGMIATVAMVAVASGLYLANNSPAPSTGTAAFSGDVGDKYVPAILRNQAANQGSSLDMFKDTNKGALAEEAPAAAAAKPKDNAAEAAAAEADPQAQEPGAPEGDNMAQDMMAKLQGGNMASLTSQLGGGSSKFSNMGGFNNKFNSGATGNKTAFTSGIGSGFSSMPKFDQRKQKMLAMKGSARPVFGGAKAGKKGNIAAGAWNQAKGMREIQKSYTGDTADGTRSTQDKAWEGTTDSGDASGGAGLSDGGAGIVSSPSLDNVGDTSSSGGPGLGDDPQVPPTSGSTDDSPWGGMPEEAMTYILLSVVLSVAGAYLISIGQGPLAWLKIVGYILCVLALLAALYAVSLGIKMMGEHGQELMGTIYTIGGGIAAVGAVVAMMGDPAKALVTKVAWIGAIAGILSLMGSMLGGGGQ